jgi:type I restriction enzyme S subunit
MSSELKNCLWGEIATLEYGKSLRDYSDVKEGIPVYGTNGPIGYTEKSLSDKPGVIIGRKGAYRGVHYSPGPFFVIDTAFYLKPKIDDLDIKYAYYQLLTQDINIMDSGSAIPSTSRDDFYGLELSLPSLSTQRRIASILTALDDKIELNRRMNETLEGIAQALWGEWFGKYASGEEELPEGWRWGKLDEVLEIKYGKDHKNLESGHIPVYGSGGIMRHVSKSIYDDDSILIPRKGTLSNLFYVSKPFWSVDTMFYSKIKMRFSGKYLFMLLKSLKLETMNIGSAVPSLTTEILNNLEILIPDEDVLMQFDHVVSSCFEIKDENENQSHTLTALRDVLLPRLMRGEVMF